MSGLELRLPRLTEGAPEEQLRQLRSYLYQLTEQLQMELGSREEGGSCPDTQALLEQAVALSAKRGDGRYAGLEALEDPWRKLTGALETLEAGAWAGGEPAAEMPKQQLCTAGCPGVQTREGETVRFAPLLPWVRTPDGHWQIP